MPWTKFLWVCCIGWNGDNALNQSIVENSTGISQTRHQVGATAARTGVVFNAMLLCTFHCYFAVACGYSAISMAFLNLMNAQYAYFGTPLDIHVIYLRCSAPPINLPSLHRNDVHPCRSFLTRVGLVATNTHPTIVPRPSHCRKNTILVFTARLLCNLTLQ
jgi:hypothetical protein